MDETLSMIIGVSFSLPGLKYTPHLHFFNYPFHIGQRLRVAQRVHAFSALAQGQPCAFTKSLRQLTNNGPIPRTRNPQHLALNLPTTMQTQGRKPDPIHRIRALPASFAA